MSRPKALLAWSSGKDSAWALHVLRARGEYDVVGLLTTVTETYARVSMHGVRETLLEAQAAAVGMPLRRVSIPSPCSNDEYEAAMRDAMETAKAEGITHVAFGDLFLEDLRAYRKAQLAQVDMTALFPVWEPDTVTLAREMVEAGVRAYLTCVDPRVMPRAFAGRMFDATLLADLPEGIDPCGENGEFHSFAFDGPAFTHPVPVHVGETVERDGFVFTDLLPPDGV